MCGFAGWFDLVADVGPPPPEPARRAALDALASRGPDGDGSVVAPDGRFGLLHRRLAVVDREGGAQPMAGPVPGQWLAWNGELFDHLEHRAALLRQGEALRTRSDTEVLARLLARRGIGALPGLRAQYALCFVDADGSLRLARDPQGEKPLYWCVGGGRLHFASTLEALAALHPFPRDVDREALSLYLSWGFVPAPRTIFRHVRKLAAGHQLLARLGAEASVVVVPTPRGRAPDPPDAPSGEDATAALGHALRDAARLRLESSDEPVGLFLSGGLDSLAVAAVLRDVPGLRTFTVRSEDPELDESEDAARAARALGLAHQVIEPPAASDEGWRDVFLRHGEPFGSASAVAVDAVARAARSHVKVALTGDGGDEALGGYPRHVLLMRLARARVAGLRVPVPRWLGDRGDRLRRAFELTALDGSDRYASMYEVLGPWRSRILPGDDGEPARAEVRRLFRGAAADDLDAMLRVDRALELPDSHCVKVDVQCMGNGVEPRSPWLDPRVVAVCDAIPAAERMRGRRTKLPLRELLRRELPRSFPRHLLERRKRGFTTGFDAALSAPEVGELLGALDRVPGVDASAAHALWQEHASGRGRHRFRVSVLVGLSLFAECGLLRRGAR